MAGINKVIIVGNVGNVEIKSTGGGSTVANLSIATSHKYTNKEGNKIEATEWHHIVFFGRTAEVIRDYVTKGAKLYVEGMIKTEKWQDKDGNDRYSTKIYGREMQMLSGKKDGGGGSQHSHAGDAKEYAAQSGGTMHESFDEDDVPF